VFLEAEAADPNLAKPYERKLLQFRTFSPRPETIPPAEWQPDTATAASTPAASRPGDAGAAAAFLTDAEWPEPPAGWFDDPLAIWQVPRH
jgi:hypothetical protein